LFGYTVLFSREKRTKALNVTNLLPNVAFLDDPGKEKFQQYPGDLSGETAPLRAQNIQFPLFFLSQVNTELVIPEGTERVLFSMFLLQKACVVFLQKIRQRYFVADEVLNQASPDYCHANTPNRGGFFYGASLLFRQHDRYSNVSLVSAFLPQSNSSCDWSQFTGCVSLMT
jgi:hypothetical protein